MGLEDYSVALKPASARPQPLALDALTQTLAAEGFRQSDPVRHVGPAQLARPACAEVAFVRERPSAVVEALLYLGPGPAEPDEVQSVSVRVAVCQPDGAAEAFLGAVRALMVAHGLVVRDAERSYDIGDFGDFSVAARADIAEAKRRWYALFPGVREEVVLPASQAWAHFRAKRASACAGHSSPAAPPDAVQ